MYKLLLSLIILSFLFLGSCKEDEEAAPFIDPEFQTYVDSFLAEAASKGIELPRADLLTAEFANDLPEGICGMGNANWPVNPRIRIRNSDGCWFDRTSIEKENFIFHELGHALLDRAHTSKVFDNQYPSSLMCSDQVEVYQCQPFNTYYTQEMRAYYVDELFDETTEVPTWISGDVTLEQTIFDHTISSVADDWETLTLRTEDNTLFSYEITNETDEPFALSISQNSALGNAERYVNPSGLWFRMFEVENIPDCSRFRAKARVNIPESFDGLLEIGLSLRERNDQDELERFALHFTTENHLERIDSEYALMEVEIPCVPSKTEVLTLTLAFNSSQPTTVVFDEIEVSLWD